MPGVLSVYHEKIKSGLLQRDPAQEKAATLLSDLAHDLQGHDPQPGLLARLKKKKSVKGLYFYGGVGRGKSMLMDLFFSAAPVAKKRRVHFHAFMLEVHDFMHGWRQRQADVEDTSNALLAAAENIVQDTYLLCFDEFHVTDVADAMILGRLFTALFDRGVVVVATSNWPPDQLYKDGLQRELFLPFIQLLKERLTVFAFEGPLDYRMEKLRSLGVYFSPLDADTRLQADRVFAALADGVAPQPEKITVKGRVVEIPQVARNVARISFANFCAKPLGAEDYLLVAQNYPTVFLEGVPKLNDDTRNETKRFMTLIDVFYERKVRLFITAAAAPEKLYTGKQLAFEFGRTVSRLIEMQSETYLKSA